MSAPNQGRQSPEPENQSDAQTGASSGNPNDQGGAPKGSNAADKSTDQLKGLESNPTPVLDHASKEKTAKGNGNPDLGGH